MDSVSPPCTQMKGPPEGDSGAAQIHRLRRTIHLTIASLTSETMTNATPNIKKPATIRIGAQSISASPQSVVVRDRQRASVTGETITALVVQGLIVRDGRRRLVLTDEGRATLLALQPGL
jgi:hypothetical protein